MSNLTFGFVATPLSIFKFLQLEKLSQSEIAILSYVIEHFLNFQRGNRAWVSIPKTELSKILSIHPKTIQISIRRLIQIGIIEEKSEAVKTSGGVQKGRAIRIADFDKIGELCANLYGRANDFQEAKVVVRSLLPLS